MVKLRAFLGVWLISASGPWVFSAAAFAETLGPEDTLRTFYGLIDQHRCDEAAALAIGYSAVRCGRVLSAKLGEVKKTGDSAPDRVAFEVQLSFRKKNERAVRVSAVVPLRRSGSAWLIDIAAVRYVRNRRPAPQSAIDAPAAASAASVAASSGTGPVRSSTESSRLPELHARTSPPLTTPDTVRSGERNLMALWTTEALRGQAGEERIVTLPAADQRSPPEAEPEEALPPLPDKSRKSIRRVHPPTGRKWVALTFDLCEQADEIAGYDRGIVNVLRDKSAKATFFAGGKWMQTHLERTMQLMADPLFEIGNHAWTHGNLRVLKGAKLREQIVWTQAAYQSVRNDLSRKAAARGLDQAMARVPRQMKSFRFPYGTCSQEALEAVNGYGLSAIQWDVLSGDPGRIAPTKSILQSVRPGSIVVFHANGRGHGTAGALAGIIDGLKMKGYEFKTVSEMLEQGTPEAVAECYELKPGDNSRYDALFGDGTTRIRRGAEASKGMPVSKALAGT